MRARCAKVGRDGKAKEKKDRLIAMQKIEAHLEAGKQVTEVTDVTDVTEDRGAPRGGQAGAIATTPTAASGHPLHPLHLLHLLQVRFGEWPNKELDVVNDLNLLTAKTSLYLINMSEKDYIRRGRRVTDA